MANNKRFRLKAERIKQLTDQPFDTAMIGRLHRETMLGAWYFEDQNRSIYRRNNSEFTLLAFDMLSDLSRQDTLDLIVQFFLEDLQQNRYRNTIEKAEILSRLIPYLLKDAATIESRTFHFSGERNQSFSNFPLELHLPADEALSFYKSGTGPLFVSLSQSQWESDHEAKTELVEITTNFYQDDKLVVDTIRQGNPLIMEVTLNAKRKGEYLMLEIPIPAGCSYGNKNRFPNWRENHREYYKHQVISYLQVLPEGETTLKIELEPLYSGKFILNPSRAELMYYPALQANNLGKRVSISE